MSLRVVHGRKLRPLPAASDPFVSIYPSIAHQSLSSTTDGISKPQQNSEQKALPVARSRAWLRDRTGDIKTKKLTFRPGDWPPGRTERPTCGRVEWTGGRVPCRSCRGKILSCSTTLATELVAHTSGVQAVAAQQTTKACR